MFVWLACILCLLLRRAAAEGAGSPSCIEGVLSRYSYHGICCPASCGRCDDSPTCTDKSCCSAVIANSGRYCNTVGPPCIVACGPGTGDRPLSTTGRCSLCPVGTYSNGTQDVRRHPRPPCMPCKNGTSTAYLGALSESECQSQFLLHQPSPSDTYLAVPHNNATSGSNVAVFGISGWTILYHSNRFMLFNGTAAAANNTQPGAFLVVKGLCVVSACPNCSTRSRLILAACETHPNQTGLQQREVSAQARWQYQRSTGRLRWLGGPPSKAVLCLTVEANVVAGFMGWRPVLTASSCSAGGTTAATWLQVSAEPPATALAQVPTPLQVPLQLSYREWSAAAKCQWLDEGSSTYGIPINCTAGSSASTTCHTAAGAPQPGSNVGTATSACCWQACHAARMAAGGRCEERGGPPGAGDASVATLPWSMRLHITIPEPGSSSSSSAANTTAATVITCNPGPVYLKDMPGFYDDHKTLCPVWAWFYIQTAPWCLRPTFDLNPRGWSGFLRGSVAAASINKDSSTAARDSSTGSTTARGSTGTGVIPVCTYRASLAYVVNVSDLTVTVKRLFDAVWDAQVCGTGDTTHRWVNASTQYIDGALTRADVARLVGRTINLKPEPYFMGYGKTGYPKW